MSILCQVGISCDFEVVTDRRGAPAPRYLLPEAYVRATNWAGLAAVVLPHQAPKLAAGLLQHVQGLVISGGDCDVPPSYYHESPSPKLGRVLEPRSAFERALLQEALARRMPILGICGGMQLLNVVTGGTLYQDLSARQNTQIHEQPQDKRQPFHRVQVTPGSHLAAAYGQAEHLQVNSTHHQVVKQLGAEVIATGVAPDGVIEAIEVTSQPFAIGLQWHPEVLEDAAQWGVYKALAAAMQNFAKAAH